MAETTPFTIGAGADCTDGVCGEVGRVVADPVAWPVTHLVAQPKHRHGPVRLVGTVFPQTRSRRRLYVLFVMEIRAVQGCAGRDGVYGNVTGTESSTPLGNDLSRASAHDRWHTGTAGRTQGRASCQAMS